MKKQEQQPEDAERYSTYERNRRNRFNAILKTLAQVLPGYKGVETAKGGRQQQPLAEATAGSACCKWSKREVVERAIAHIRRLQAGRGLGQSSHVHVQDPVSATNDDTELANTIKRLRIQNRLLRRLIVSELKLPVDEKRADLLTVKQIKEVIRTQTHQESTDANAEAPPVAVSEEVFVAPVAACSDHTYSLVVQDHVDIEVSTESQIESIRVYDENQDSSESSPVIPVSPEPPLLQQPCPTKESAVVSLPQLTLFPSTSLSLGSTFGNFAVVSTAALGHQYVLSSFPANGLFLGPATSSKLPLPRLPPVTSSKATKRQVLSANVSRKKTEAVREKESKKTTRPVDVQKSSPTEVSVTVTGKSKDSSVPSAPEVASSSPAEEVSAFSFSDVTNINSTLPDTLLATEDDAAPEVVDLTQGQANASESSGGKFTKVVSLEKRQLSVKDRKRAKESEPAEGVGTAKSKRSRSSYSIAALCQISVNIGEPVEAGMISSPGLASLGTASPVGTPVPTPTPPRLDAASGSAPPSASTATSSHTQELSAASSQASGADSVKEVRKAAAAATLDQKVVAEKSQLSKKATAVTVSPSKSFLTSFPVVSVSSSEFGGAVGDSHRPVIAVSQRSRQEGAKDFSVFDFSEPRESPPVMKQFANKAASISSDPANSATSSREAEKQVLPPVIEKRVDLPAPPSIRVTALSTLAQPRAEPQTASAVSAPSLASTSKGTWLSSSSVVASASASGSTASKATAPSSSTSVSLAASTSAPLTSTHSQLHSLPSLHHYPPLTACQPSMSSSVSVSGSGVVANVSYSRSHAGCTSSTSALQDYVPPTLQHISAAVAADRLSGYHHPYQPHQHQYQPSYSRYYPTNSSGPGLPPSSSGGSSGAHYSPATSSVLGNTVDYQSSTSRQAGSDCYGTKGYLALSSVNTMPYHYGMMTSSTTSVTATSTGSSKSDRKPRSSAVLTSETSRSRSSSLDPKMISPPATGAAQQQSQHGANQTLQLSQAQQCQLLHNDQGKMFSVNNLVSADPQAQARRSNKQRATAAASSSSLSSPANSYTKSQRQPLIVRSDPKEEQLTKRSSKPSAATASRLPRSSSGRMKISYMAESLISGSAVCLDPSALNMASVHGDVGKIHSYDLESKSGGGWVDSGQSGMCAPFALFPAMSPSPASFYDYGLDLNNVADGATLTTSIPTSKHYGTQQQAQLLASTNLIESHPHPQQSRSGGDAGKSQSRTSSIVQQSMAPLDSFAQALERNLGNPSDPTQQQQQYFSHALFDGGGYIPLSTLTPPASTHHADESMVYFTAPNSLYPTPISNQQQSGRNGGAYQTYSAVHGGSGKNSHADGGSGLGSGLGQQLTAAPLHSGGALNTTSTSNLSNFNLSTILPEMHSSSEKLLAPSSWAGDAAMSISTLTNPISGGGLDPRQQPLPSHNALLFTQGHGHQLQQLRH